MIIRKIDPSIKKYHLFALECLQWIPGRDGQVVVGALGHVALIYNRVGVDIAEDYENHHLFSCNQVKSFNCI